MARHATRSEVIQINDLLREHFEIIRPKNGDEPGFGRYQDNWDDKRVASVVSSTLSHSSVASIRVEMFGHIRLPGQQNASQEDLDRVVQRLTDAVTRNAALEKTILEMQERFNRLAYALHLKQVADVKHLCFVRSDGSVPGVMAAKKVAG